MSKIPQRFVGLHGHSGQSVYDGLGPASEHFKFCRENGLDGHAITEHGHFNSFALAYIFIEKWRKEGINFKYIPGIETYVHPDLKQWKRDKEKYEEDAEAERTAAKEAKKAKELREALFALDDDDAVHESSNALTIENEDETRSGKAMNPANRRHHLVLLPKTHRALQKLFRLSSRGYLEGFYRFPRVDAKMLREAANDENDIFVSTACLGGPLSYAIFEQLRDTPWASLNSMMLDDTNLLDRCVTAATNALDVYASAVGPKNVLLEMQFNRIPAQDVVNRVIIELARRNGMTNQLIVTCDSHYPRPEQWYHREMYKKLGHLNYTDIGPESLPKSRDELKCELYPKNAQQVWDEYLKSKERSAFYERTGCDDIVCEAIERTHDIAHSAIDDAAFDKSYKFPTRLVPTGKTPIQRLAEMCKEGIIRRGLHKKPEYIERLKMELEVIKKMNFAPYFITLQRVMELARSVCLCGVARGSGGGSLVAYCLHITDLDPIKYECRFDRFLNVNREGAPDIDVDVADRDAVLEVLRKEFGYNNVLPISNYNTFKVKTLVKDISKFYGIPFEEVNAATKTVENDVRKATQKHGDDKNLFVLKFDDAMVHSPSFKAFIDKHPQIAETINILFKEQRSLGRHAGGVVIMDDAPGMMPVITSGGEPQTPWVEGVEVKTLEPLGYIKYDLLGLETMRLIQRSIELILQRHAGVKKPTFEQVREWYEKHLHPDANDYDDSEAYKHVYHDGNFAGIFQLTSSGAQRLFKAAKPKNIVDIAVLTSIYRPGPLAAKVDKLYIAARAGEKYDWGHPLFEKVLGKTNNLLIFQESVMDLAEHVGGFPKDQCDKVRKAIMKRSISGGEEAKKKAREMEEAFVTGAIAKGVPELVAHEAYQKILWFAGYGFNKCVTFSTVIDTYQLNGDKVISCTPKRICNIKPGELVLTRDELTQQNTLTNVRAIHDNGLKDVVTTTLVTGESFTTTWDHKFRVETGEMMPLYEIIAMDASIVVDSLRTTATVVIE